MTDPTPENDRQRVIRRDNLAYEAGKREAQVDGTLEAHERRLNAINGSIDKTGRSVTDLATSVDSLSDKLDQVTNGLNMRDAVQRALSDKVEEANSNMKEATERQISSIGFYLATAGVIATIAGLIFTVLIGLHII
jgi:phage shock protein A